MQRPSGEQEWDAFWELEYIQCGWHRVGEVAKDEARDPSRGPPVLCSSRGRAQTNSMDIPRETYSKRTISGPMPNVLNPNPDRLDLHN